MTPDLAVFAAGLAAGALLVATGVWVAEASRQYRHRERSRRRRMLVSPLVPTGNVRLIPGGTVPDDEGRCVVFDTPTTAREVKHRD